MFSGIISHIGTIEKSEMKKGSLFLTVQKPPDWKIKPGDSIATNGVCLTVKEVKVKTYTTELMPETLNKTTYGTYVPKQVNLEQSLTLQSSLDGHLVFGHVDTIGKITKIQHIDNSTIFTISIPSEFKKLVAPKGSIAVDGISLTVVDVGDDWFTVSIVEYTMQHTNLQYRHLNENINVEFDMLAKYVSRLLEVAKN